MDIALNSNFDIYLNDRNDLATVYDHAAFEQRLAIAVTDYFYKILGESGRQNIISLVEVQIRRVIQNEQAVDDVADYDVRFSESDSNQIEVTIVYDAGDPFELTLSE